uniref:Prephenate dehydrogenase/arogenate dehydrogenase family protein n=1 Tax=Thermodesulfobacterium geofontis TaxID=1295609 RepID=A0A7V5XGH5_9BACT
MDENFRIGIIGGKGKMGNFFKSLFEKRGYLVEVSDVNTSLSNTELVKRNKIILISVPIEIFSEVVIEISSFVKEDHWIIDICSLKKEPVKVMKKFLKRGEILATHPLFGPYEKDLKGKTIAFYPVRGKEIVRWFKNLMISEGLNVVRIPPKRHDEIMALVQVINHFWLIILAKTIKDSEFNLKDVVCLSTPSFLRQLHILKRLAKQDPNLYAKIQLENPLGKKFRNLLCKNCKNLAKAFNSKKAEEEFKEYFTLAKEIAKELEILLDQVFLEEV